MFCPLLDSASLFDAFVADLLHNCNLNISCLELLHLYLKKVMYLGDEE